MLLSRLAVAVASEAAAAGSFDFGGGAGGWSALASRRRLFVVDPFDAWAGRYPPVSGRLRLELREKARAMFTFGYDNYLRHAFPLDELDPIHCTGRGPDYDNP